MTMKREEAQKAASTRTKQTLEILAGLWGISEETLKPHYDWLLEDTLDEKNRMTRGLGCKEYGGQLIRLKRAYGPDGLVAHYREDDQRLWSGYPYVTSGDIVGPRKSEITLRIDHEIDEDGYYESTWPAALYDAESSTWRGAYCVTTAGQHEEKIRVHYSNRQHARATQEAAVVAAMVEMGKMMREPKAPYKVYLRNINALLIEPVK